MYLRWRRLLPAWIEILPIEPPGRGARLSEPLVEDFDSLVAMLCREYGSRLSGDYALFGHSMGALLAYGMALHLRERGRTLPRALLVSASPAPSRRDEDYFVGKDNDVALIADLRRHGGTSEDVLANPELMRIVLDALGSDYRVCESFRYRDIPPLPMAVHVLAGQKDDIEADRVEAWARESSVGATLDWFDGGHFFVRQQEAQVLAAIRRHLGRGLEAGAADAARTVA